MLYEFRSRATGTVTMTGAVAQQILALLGKSPSGRGVLTVAQLPAAIAALEAAVAAEKAQAQAAAAQPAPADTAEDQDEDDGPAADPVSLAQRAWPLIDMFKQSLAGDADVTWGV